MLIGGGARSGKSSRAIQLARESGTTRAFVATAEGLDDEMRDRISRHQRERGADFETLEAPLALVQAIDGIRSDVVVVDCLTLWISNLLCRDESDAAILARAEELIERLARRDRTYILVTNEVGLGLVPDNPLGRRFRDLTGTINQRMAAAADEVYFGMMGLMLRVKPAPVSVAAG